MGIPFSLSISNRELNKERLYFYDSKHQINKIKENNIPEIIEYTPLSIIFNSSEPKDKMFMDGFDVLELKELSEDDYGRKFLAPSEEEIQIYNLNKEDAKTPLIPGFYEISIESYGKTYYSWVNVIPKSLNKAQWITMKDEIEDTLLGLSNELMRRSTSTVISNTNSSLPLPLINKVLMLKKNIGKINRIIEDIEINPRNSIEKKYQWQYIGKKSIIDNKTILEYGKHPEKKNDIYAPQRIIDYNISENKYLKYFFIFFKKFSRNTLCYMEKYKEGLVKELNKTNTLYSTKRDSLEREIKEISAHIKLLERFGRRVSRLLNSDWMVEVASHKDYFFPKAMMLDTRYNFMYKLYLDLKKENYNLQFNENYQYFWKRTDLLYEIWGYIQVMKALQDLKYLPVSGWIFDNNQWMEGKIPFLLDNTRIKFKKENIEINLVYNAKIPRSSNETNIDNPIYTKSNNNKPDIRLDILVNEGYCGSLILDTKYRPLRNIWSHKGNDTKTQLRNYRTTMESKLLMLYLPEHIRKRVRPVEEVWVLYPKYEQGAAFSDPYYDEYIYLLELSPGFNQDELSKRLNHYINETARIE